MSEFGIVVNVAVAQLGSELAVAAAIGATTLTVVDAVDFSEDGGSLTVGAETVAYAGVDDEAGVITLSAPLAAAHDVTDRVNLYPAGYVKTAQVSLGADTEAVEARVPHGLWDRVPEGTRDATTAESVSLGFDDGEFVLADVLGTAPMVDASYLEPGSLRDAIPADYTYLGNVAVENLVGRFLWTQLVLAGSTTDVARSEMDSDGFRAYRSDGTVFFNVSPAQALVIADGIISAQSLTTKLNSSLGGVTEVAKGGALRLTKGTTAPANAPTVTLEYPSQQFAADGLWPNRYGWATDGTYWYTARLVSGSAQVEKWSGNGTLVAATGAAFSADTWLGGVAVSGGNVYMLARGTAGAGVPFVYKFSTSTLAYLDYAIWNDANGGRVPAIGVDPATGELLIAQARTTDNFVRIRRYTYNPSTQTTAGNLTAGTFVDTTVTDAGDLAGVVYGSFDLGAPRYLYVKRSLTGGAGEDVRVLNTSGVRQTDQWFNNGASNGVGGLAWDGTAFRSMSLYGLQRIYTGITEDTLYFSNTLRSATAETDQSPRAMVTGTRRTRPTVTTSSIETTADPNDPAAVSIYAGTATGRLNMWRQSVPANGVTTVALTAIATTGTNPPLNNGFGTGIPSVLQTWDAQTMIDALGAIPAGPFRASVKAAVTKADVGIDRGYFTGPCDASGNVTVTHTLGVSPVSVTFGGDSAGTYAVVGAPPAANFAVKCRDAAGVLRPSGFVVSFYWMAMT